MSKKFYESCFVNTVFHLLLVNGMIVKDLCFIAGCISEGTKNTNTEHNWTAMGV